VKPPKLYQINEFAEMAGVTVRALHHYDRLGLMKPARRDGSAYRLYSERDLERLEQIVVLKFLGLPLKEIGALLRDERTGLSGALERQEKVLREKRRQLDQAIHAVAEARRNVREGQDQPELLTKIIKEIKMQDDTNWTSKYYSGEAKEKMEARKALWSPEMQEQVTKQWNDLFQDVEAAIAAGEDPAGDRAQSLAARWKKLVGAFTGGDPEIQKGLNAMHKDSQNWPAERQQYAVKPSIQEFIMKAMQAGK
jgi:DNA-binding transcriptional MerR regulator